MFILRPIRCVTRCEGRPFTDIFGLNGLVCETFDWLGATFGKLVGDDVFGRVGKATKGDVTNVGGVDGGDCIEITSKMSVVL